MLDTLEVETERGTLKLGVSDRVQFHGNDRRAGIFNGSVATIEAIQGTRITARTDDGQEVEWDTEAFKDFAYGYAGTVYRGQGKTQTDVYALYDNAFAWNARTAYVGLTRHKSRIELYVSTDLAPDEPGLARRMSRQFRDEASLAWATPDEVRRRETGDRSAAQTERFPREEMDALRRIDLTAYARDVHGYSAMPDPSGKRGQFVLERTDAKGAKETLEVRRAADGHWTFRDPAQHSKRGDIFDLAVKEGAPSLEAACKDVATYSLGRASPDPAASQGSRSRYDQLRDAEAKARERAPDRAKNDVTEKPLSFTKDRGSSGDDAKDKGKVVGLKFTKDRDKDDDRSR